MLAWQAIDRTHRIGQLRPVTAVRWLSWRVATKSVFYEYPHLINARVYARMQQVHYG